MANVSGLGGTITGDATQFVGGRSKRADINGDGNVSTAEFAQFLAQRIRKSDASGVPPASAAETPASAALDAIGRILGGFPPTPAGLAEAVSSLRQAVPGTTLLGHDHLDIPGVGRINVGFSFGNSGGPAWRAAGHQGVEREA